MAQITSIVSEALQAKIRTLLPSQAGFTEDLQAQNVIVPIVDLTETASGSALRQDLQTSIAFASQNVFDVSNATTTVANIGGFHRLIGSSFVRVKNSGNTPQVDVILSDGATSKIVWGTVADQTTIEGIGVLNLDFVFFLRSTDSLIVQASTDAQAIGSVRQIADLTGNLVNPSGYTAE